MANRPLPPRSGNGREVGDVRLQAQHYTTRCLETLGKLIEDDDVDLRLRFSIMKFMIELGWGRPRQMAAPAAPDRTAITLDGRLEEIFKQLMDRDTDDDDSDGRPGEGVRLLPGPDGDAMECDGTASAKNA